MSKSRGRERHIKQGRRKSTDRPTRVHARKRKPIDRPSGPALPSLTIPVSVPTYDRAAALRFARQFWTKVCPDLHIGVSASPGVKAVPAGTVFEREAAGEGFTEVAKLPDGTKLPFAQLEDCAHYVSNCLGKPNGHRAGGLSIPSEFAKAYGLFGANKLFVHLKNEGLISIVQSESLTEKQAEARLTSLAEGDLIFYRPRSNSAYRHVGIYMADTEKRIACHTYCRADVDDSHPLPQGWKSVGFTDDTTLYTLAKVL